MLGHPGEGGFERGAIGDVGGYEQELRIARPIAIAGTDRGRVVGQIEYPDPGPLIGEPGGEGVAELAEAAGDDDGPTLEVEAVDHATRPGEVRSRIATIRF
jgi:hypothetical protein